MIVTRAVAKWLPICVICCLGTILGLDSGLVLEYIYPGYVSKRMLQMGSMDVQIESAKLISNSGSEINQATKSVLKSGHDDANPSSKRSELLPDEAELLEGMDMMQFHKGRRTSYKRSWPIPQLQCQDGCDSYEPTMVQCTNIKLPDQESKWRCEMDLPRHLKFQKTTINCESFESEQDNRILRGSCGLQYSLANSGLKPIPGRVHRHYYTVNTSPDRERMKGWTASWLVVIGVITYLIKHNWNSFKSPGLETKGLRAKVVTAHKAWKRGTKGA